MRCVTSMGDHGGGVAHQGQEEEITMQETVTDLDEVSAILARDLREGDVVLNVGTVNTPPRRNGVFVECEVVCRVWSTFTGRQIPGVVHAVLHESEQVFVVQEEQSPDTIARVATVEA